MRKTILKCDACGKECEQEEASIWFSIDIIPCTSVEFSGVTQFPTGDFCGLECLQSYITDFGTLPDGDIVRKSTFQSPMVLKLAGDERDK